MVKQLLAMIYFMLVCLQYWSLCLLPLWIDIWLQECYSLTSNLLENDPYATEAYPVHITASLELRKKNELFKRAHKYAALALNKALAFYITKFSRFRTFAAVSC